MFTGIIEQMGKIESPDLPAEGGRLTILAPEVAASLAVSSSIAVNGCCLTVVSSDSMRFAADLSGETLRRTSFGELKPGALVNLERPLTAGKEFGGHFVQGHIDGIGRVAHLKPEGESWWLGVRVPEEIARFVATKGSIAVDGISLSVAGWRVRHILPRRPDGEAGGHREPHPLTPFLVVDGGRISYPAAQGTLALGSARVPE